MLVIEKATLEDSPILSEIQIQAWLDGYANPTEGILQVDIEAKTDEWKKLGNHRLDAKVTESGTQTWIAKEDGQIIGFIGIKDSGNSIELEGLFVSPLHQRKGVGSALMKKVLSTIDSTKLLKLEVMYYNQKAIRFYKSFGFKEQSDLAGSTITLANGKVIRNIVMIKS